MHISRPKLLCSDLDTLENALLWTMRAWVIGHCQRVNIAHRIDRVFEQFGAPEGAGCLGGFMWALSRGAKRVLEINCVCHPEVSGDEATLLHVFGLQQEEAHEEAFTILTGMTIERATAAACDSAYRLVLALNEAGHALPRSTATSHRLSTGATSDPFRSAPPQYIH